MNRISWLDSVRVFSSLLVIISHYVNCFNNFDNFPIMRAFFSQTGAVGVFLFFALSGYLVNTSLERSNGLLNFYKRRMVRVCVPFIVAHFVLGTALMILSMVEPSLANYSPFNEAMYKGGFPKRVLFGMFPHDVNLTTFLGFGMEVFVGEWFIGTIIWLYLIAPFLYKAVLRAPVITFVAAILISVATFYSTTEMAACGEILQSWWLFPTKIPEFLFGMILAVHKDFFEINRRKILIAVSSWTVIVGTIFIIIKPEVPELMLRLYPYSPRSLLLSLTTIYLFFVFTEYINRKFPNVLAPFNSFTDISYMSMLIQHIVIYIVADRLELEELRTFGLIYSLFLITLIIIYASRFIKNFSDPLEKYFFKRKQNVL